MVIFHVRSSSHPDKYYEVSVTESPVGAQWTCGCIGWSFSKKGSCRHVKACEGVLTSGVQRMYYETDPYQPFEQENITV